MTYTIKCISGIHSTADFVIKGGQEKEVSKEIYDYFNNRFGASGSFNFSVKDTPKKAKSVPSVNKEDEVVKEKVTKKRTTKKVEDN